MTAHSIRVPLVQPGTRPELATIEARIQAERGRISTLYQALLNSAPIAEGWEAMLTAVRKRTQVPPALRELIILRVAVLNGADYEFDAHVPHALQAGLAQARIDAAREEGIAPLFTPEERLVLELTDCMTRDIQVPAPLFHAVQRHFGSTVSVEITATAAAYNMVSRFLLALGIQH